MPENRMATLDCDGFRIFEHTADAGVEARGSSQEELFENCAWGMFHIAFDGPPPSCGEPESRDVVIEGNQGEELLYGFLSHLLYLMDGEGFIPCGFHDCRLTGDRFSVRVDGNICRESFPLVEIKAVTYHALEIKESAGIWQTSVIFDI